MGEPITVAAQDVYVLCVDLSGKIVDAGPSRWPPALTREPSLCGLALEMCLDETLHRAVRTGLVETPTPASVFACTVLLADGVWNLQVTRALSSWIVRVARCDPSATACGFSSCASGGISASALSDAGTRGVLDTLDALGLGAALYSRAGALLLYNEQARAMLDEDTLSGLGGRRGEGTSRLVDRQYHALPLEAHPVSRARERGFATHAQIGVLAPADRVAPSQETPGRKPRILRWLDVRATPLRDARGLVTGALCCFEDQTHRRQVLDELRSDYLLLQQILSTSSAGIVVLDPQGQILFANAVTERLLRITRSDLISRRYNAPQWTFYTLDGEPLPDEERAFARVLRTREHVDDVRHRIELDDGTLLDLSVSGSPVFDEHGMLLRLVFFIVDITERMEVERERERIRREVYELNRIESLAVMAGGIAHDFNNLLVGILGSAHLLRAELPGTFGASEQGEHLDWIIESAQEASMLTHQLLAYSGRGSFSIQVVGLNVLLEDMRALFHSMLVPGVSLEIDAAWAPPVRTDQTQLRQILLNLTLNAVQAIDGAGTITMRTGERVVTGREGALSTPPGVGQPEPGHYATLEIQDTGCGMTDEVRQRLFEPFFTTKSRGHGLGLAAVLGVVRGQGGFITVDAASGGGTLFTLGFPALSSLDAASSECLSVESEVMESEAVAMPEVVLLVDDDPTVRRLITRLLQREQCAVIEACDGVEGLRLFQAHHHRIDAVIADLTMPRMGGVELAESLRTLRRGLPIVLTSGYADEEFPALGWPHLFLAKPFTPEALYRALRSVLAPML